KIIQRIASSHRRGYLSQPCGPVRDSFAQQVRRAHHAVWPPEFLPELATSLAPGLHITRSAEEAVRGADVIMVLRVQKERLAGMKIKLQDYIARYQMTMTRLKLAKRVALLMHPGPIIRGLELTWEVADCPQSAIVEEVRNGVPVRMAILAKALGRAR